MQVLSLVGQLHLWPIGLRPCRGALHRLWAVRSVRAFWSYHWNAPVQTLLKESMGPAHPLSIWAVSGGWHLYGLWLWDSARHPPAWVGWRAACICSFFALQPVLLELETRTCTTTASSIDNMPGTRRKQHGKCCNGSGAKLVRVMSLCSVVLFVAPLSVPTIRKLEV
eukprot:COSAG01_NODE_3887_length_5585_cov_3.982501_5_plen_167_part_00